MKLFLSKEAVAELILESFQAIVILARFLHFHRKQKEKE
jgi:hypothetical protein